MMYAGETHTQREGDTQTTQQRQEQTHIQSADAQEDKHIIIGCEKHVNKARITGNS